MTQILESDRTNEFGYSKDYRDQILTVSSSAVFYILDG